MVPLRVGPADDTRTRPESALLLGCARTRLDTRSAARIRALLSTEIDWAYLVQVADRHGVLPLLYGSLTRTCTEAVPAAILVQLQQHVYANAASSLSRARELLQVLRLFEAQGIQATPYKGPVLVSSVYGNLALREFNDLDILVHPRDVLQARDLLLAGGYRSDRVLTREQAADLLKSNVAYNYKLVREKDGILVELHWAITSRENPFLLELAQAWERRQPVSLLGAEVLTFAPEDLLLILCQHGSKHKWKRLKWICDVAELVCAHPELDWGQVLRQAQELGSRRMLFLGLILARDLLGTAPPESVSLRLDADRVALSLARQVWERLFLEGEDRPMGLGWRLFRHRVRERWRDRLPYFHYRTGLLCRRWLTPTAADRALLRLPPYLSPLYYLVRPVRVAMRYGSVLTRRAKD